MTQKLTKKQLKEIATNLGAIYLGGNVYTFESDIYCLKCGDATKLSRMAKEYCASSEIPRYEATQIAYSCGLYGNSGQIYRLHDTTDKVANHYIFVYYC